MAIRTSMASLITEVRRLINDPELNSGTTGSMVFTAEEIEDVLDRHRMHVVDLVLEPWSVQTATGEQTLDYQAPYGDWETDVTLRDSAHATISSGVTADYRVGRWTFDADQDDPVYLTGKTYDLMAAAADLLDRWAVKEPVTVLSSGQGQQSLSRLRSIQRQDLAKQYRKRARVRSHALGSA